MENFCGSVFWDSQLSWNTTTPELTACFQKTVLVWLPCTFLCLFAPIEIYGITYKSSKKHDIPWSWINITKLVSSLLLLIDILALSITLILDDDVRLYGADYLALLLIAVTMVIETLFVFLAKKKRIVRSGTLFVFWLLMLICFTPGLQSRIISVLDKNQQRSNGGFAMYVIFYVLVVVMFIMNCFSEKQLYRQAIREGQNPCPDEAASFLSIITFSWLDSLIWKGYKNPLERSDLYDLPHRYSSKRVLSSFDANMKKSLQTARNEKSSAVVTYANESSELRGIGSSSGHRKEMSILPSIIRTFGGEFLLSALLKFINDLLKFTTPLLLNLLIAYTENEDAAPWTGYLYAFLLFAVTQLQSLFQGQYFIKVFEIGLKIKTAVIATVYRKALTVSNSAKKETSVGEVVNLMSVDAQRFMDLCSNVNMIWSAPFQIGMALFLLWRTLGVATFAGLAVLIILIPINGLIATGIQKFQAKQMTHKDARVKLMNEILNGIKVLKLYAWEPSFGEQVLGVRKKEINILKKSVYLSTATVFLWITAPFMVSLASFAVYSIINETPMDAQLAFVSLSLFNLIKFPVTMLPILVSSMIQARVSLTRMNKFMNSEDLDPNAVLRCNDSANPVSVENGNFTWEKSEGTSELRDINMTVKDGSLVGVVGSVGAGKSSLCSALLGEMERNAGTVNVRGSVAYVAQQAWIQNATLEDNILFGKESNRNYYRRVIQACALQPDIDMLKGGDQTEIGEKGINLSGGQKQRVSLGRAVYSACDVYILDDPLSAVDSHVGKHIFEKVIGPHGLLKTKTRILVTHALTYLRQMDHIIVMKNGHISEQGSYDALIASKGEFQELIFQYLSETAQEKAEELSEIKRDLQQHIGKKEFARQISRKRQESESGADNKSVNSYEFEPLKISQQISTISAQSNKTTDSQLAKEDDLKETLKLVVEEKSETGRVSFEVYSYYFYAIGVLMMIAIFSFNIISQLFSVGSSFWLAKWSQDPTANETDVRNKYLYVYGAFGFGQALTICIASLASYLGTFNAGRLLHNSLLDRVLRLPMLFFDSNPMGRILNRFSKDMDTIDNLLSWHLNLWALCLTQALAILGVIAYNTPLFIAVMIPTVVLYYYMQNIYLASCRQFRRMESVLRSPIYSHFGESIQGAVTIRAFNKTEDFILQSQNKVDLNQGSYHSEINANRWLSVRLEFLTNILTFSAAIFAVLGKDHITSGEVGLSITYALLVTTTLNLLVRMSSNVETNIVAVERVKEYAEAVTEAPWNISQTKPQKDWPQEGAVKFKKYSSRYREGLDLVVKDIDFEVKPTEKVGIVGRTGAGKSSLTLGLFRIIEPVSGTIEIDGIDVSKIGLHDLRSRLSIIPQDPFLFSGSLRLNLDPFSAYSDEKIWNALELAHLKQFISEISNGLQHEITGGGDNLSVGQRQLVCLARALLRKTKVLILDEATAAVDMETDDLIQQTIRQEFKDCTVLIIAHRLNTIMDADKVIVLDNGEVAEFDSPDSLLAIKTSAFYSMAKDANLI